MATSLENNGDRITAVAGKHRSVARSITDGSGVLSADAPDAGAASEALDIALARLGALAAQAGQDQTALVWALLGAMDRLDATEEDISGALGRMYPAENGPMP